MRVLGGALDDAALGRLTSVIIEGEAGIGKSRLLSEGLITARDRGFQIASGRAEELERTRPFGLLVDAFDCSASSLDPRRAAIAELLAAHVGERGPITVTSDPGLQFQVVDRFVDLMEELALERPLALGVDDLQWADPSSLSTLDALSRRLTYVPVALIGCMRPSPRVEQLERMVDTLVVSEGKLLTLNRLDDDAVAGLVAEMVAADPSPELLVQVSGAGGNPLFVSELVGALVQEGAIEIVNGTAEVGELSLPPTLRLTILRRLSFLSEQALDLLRSASVLGSTFTLAELSALTSRSAVDLALLLREVFRAGVLSDDRGRLHFRHDLIREAIYADLSSSVRVALHREAGQRLATSGAPALRVAEHLARAAIHDEGDASDAIIWMIKAAREAAATAPDIAAELLHRAIELTGSADADREELLVERIGILAWAGRIAEAEAACRSLLGRPHDAAVDTSLRAALSRCLIATGRMHEAIEELERVHVSPGANDMQRAASQAWASLAHVSLGDLDTAAAVAKQARSAATLSGDAASASVAITVLASVEELRARFRNALSMIDEGIRRADDSPLRQGHRYPHHLDKGHVLIELDRFAEARATLETGMRISEELGVPWQLAAYQTVLAVERYAGGEWDDAIKEFEAGLELAAEDTGVLGTLVLGQSVISLIALHRNDVEQARQAVASAIAARELEDSYARYRGHLSVKARALLLEADGAVPQAFAALDDGWDECAAAGLAVEYSVLGPDLVRLALAVGERKRADEVTRAVAAVAANNDVSSLNGAALRCQGLLDDDPDVLCRAIDAYAQSPRPLELALVREEAGAVLGRSGDSDAAGPLLDQALETYEHLDAVRDVARTRAALREFRIHRGQRGARKRPQFGWESLTPTEQTVSDLVAEGLTNPQIGERLFVSRRTVQTHLAHVFAKLQMSSRTELAAAVTRQRERG
jgi:DNA-binding NarL/FixJ family response regulator